MNYPVLEIPFLGGSLAIAAIAIVHAFIAMFAVGGGLYLVLTERKAYREHDDRILSYVKSFSRLFILITLVAGAVTGVGIWLTIGTVSPSGVSTLIHAFVWGWAIEWVFFFMEIAAAIIYYTGWERLTRRQHQAVGWIYFVAAWLSLAVINAILSFMLTPGRWLATQGFLDGILNPSYLPSLVMRTGVCLALAGLFAFLTASRLPDEEVRTKLVHWSARWIIVAFALLPIGGAWWLLVIPPAARFIATGGAAAVTLFFALSFLFSALFILFAYIGPYRRPQGFYYPTAIMLFVLGFLVTGTGEWVREAVRKPFIIGEYMYSNAVLPPEVATISQRGILSSAVWARYDTVDAAAPQDVGREIFTLQCAACHTVEGYNGIRPLVLGWTPEFTRYQLQHLNQLKGFMPPFAGTAEELDALAAWLGTLSEPAFYPVVQEAQP